MKLNERAIFIKSVIEARSINWTQMFMDLEHTLPPGVHVVRIEPKLEKGIVSVKFVVGAVNQESELKLLKAFEESKSFSHVELTSEHAASQPGSDPLTMEFTAGLLGGLTMKNFRLQKQLIIAGLAILLLADLALAFYTVRMTDVRQNPEAFLSAQSRADFFGES